MFILYIILAIVILLFMVLIHEFGHYTIGRMLGFKITEFSIGFGKALFSRKNKRGELISLRIFPLGGYCAFAGEEDADAQNPDSFTNQKPWKRILVFLAGVTFNVAAAVIFSMILLCTVGYDIPQVNGFMPFDTQHVSNIVEGSEITNVPEGTGLQEGDIIISIRGEKIDFAYGKTYNEIMTAEISALSEYMAAYKDADNETKRLAFQEYPTIPAIVKRGDDYANVELGFYQALVNNQKYDENGDKVEGEFVQEYEYFWDVNVTAYVHTFWEAVERAVPFAFGMAWVVLKSLFLLITFQLPLSAIGGPVTTIATIASFTQTNFANILVLIPLISANLAVFNALPIPALDGAHVLFTTIEAVRKKPIKRETENMIHAIGLFILFGAVILIDILHFLL